MYLIPAWFFFFKGLYLKSFGTVPDRCNLFVSSETGSHVGQDGFELALWTGMIFNSWSSWLQSALQISCSGPGYTALILSVKLMKWSFTCSFRSAILLVFRHRHQDTADTQNSSLWEKDKLFFLSVSNIQGCAYQAPSYSCLKSY